METVLVCLCEVSILTQYYLLHHTVHIRWYLHKDVPHIMNHVIVSTPWSRIVSLCIEDWHESLVEMGEGNIPYQENRKRTWDQCSTTKNVIRKCGHLSKIKETSGSLCLKVHMPTYHTYITVYNVYRVWDTKQLPSKKADGGQRKRSILLKLQHKVWEGEPVHY